MKLPISKQLTNDLFLSCIVITGTRLYDLYATGQKQLDQNIALIILFGIPTCLLALFLLDKKAAFKDNKKAPKADRILQLPFSSFSTSFIFIIAGALLASSLAVILGDKDPNRGLPILSACLLVIILTAICIEHPKIWFSDTLNMADLLEKVKNTPKEQLPAHQDGIFSYGDDSFTVQLTKETKTIKWDDITLIRAYKIDRYAFDCIVIEIHLSEKFISINDETPGHMKFMDTAADKLPNFKKDWFITVAFPAFETNLTVIYKRETMGE